MNAPRVKTRPTSSVDTERYGELSLGQLAERIVDADRLALKELHDARLLFRLRNGESTLLARFIEGLCETRWATHLTAGNHVVLEYACDLTIDKFVHIPTNEPCSPEPGRRVPDCRNAFRSFLHVMHGLAEDGRGMTPIRYEILAAKILQRRVVRAYQRSCLDAWRRINPARSRYAWQVRGSVLYVWMPASIQHRERQEWLEKNVPDADPSRPGERCRVQAIIDERLGIPGHVSIDTCIDDMASSRACDAPAHRLIEAEIRIRGLAEVVAEEKATNIESQRPAIKALGRSRLKQLILHIFEELGEGTYEAKRLADAYGVSTASLSRFAGTRWDAETAQQVPDLWTNTAQTLAAHAPFLEAAEEAGVWDKVELVLASRARSQPRSRVDV